VSGALAVAVSPVDPHHLLLGTDTGLSRSRNGGRDWVLEAQAALAGPVFAVAFDVDGERALAAGASGLFRADGDRWRPLQAPAAMMSSIVATAQRGRAYVAGAAGTLSNRRLGRVLGTGRRRPGERARRPWVVVDRHRPEVVGAVAAGRFWTSADAGGTWQVRDGALSGYQVEAVALDQAEPDRIWSVAAGRVFRSDDHGRHWQTVGVPLPDQPLISHAVAVVDRVIVVATDRGVYRGADAGAQWSLVGDNLPAHLDAGLLAREPQNPATMYAGFALTPRHELLRRAAEGRGALSRLDVVSIGGGLAFMALLLIAGGVVVKRLARTHYRVPGSVPR
jgi:photosystem II stability/assembly factor-like uncharacterized protein